MPDASPLIARDRYPRPGPLAAPAPVEALVFIAGLVLALASLAAWGGLFFYRTRLEARSASAAEALRAKEAEARPETLAELIAFADTIKTGRDLLSAHIFASKAFRLLERTTHPRVQFTSFAFRYDGFVVELSGLAASYQSVAEQVRILEAHSAVAGVEFGGLSSSERGLVNFRLTITLWPSLLTRAGVP